MLVSGNVVLFCIPIITLHSSTEYRWTSLLEAGFMNYFALAWSRPQHFQSYNLKILCNLYLYANIVGNVGAINWGMGYGYLYIIPLFILLKSYLNPQSGNL